jgi:histone chaperone ASF1
MAKIQINNVVVLNNPALFSSPLQFEITFDCTENLEDDLEWKLTYVGCAESQDYDQVLDTIYVGPVPEGRHMFVFQADAPDQSKIPDKDLIGATVVLITCSYHNQEFIRVGYFVNNDYESEEMKENPPEKPDITQVYRNIMADQPRVTRFKINWGDNPKGGETGSETTGTVPNDMEAGEGSVVQDTDSMLEPLPSTFKDVHSMDDSSNVEMEMAF